MYAAIPDATPDDRPGLPAIMVGFLCKKALRNTQDRQLASLSSRPSSGQPSFLLSPGKRPRQSGPPKSPVCGKADGRGAPSGLRELARSDWQPRQGQGGSTGRPACRDPDAARSAQGDDPRRSRMPRRCRECHGPRPRNVLHRPNSVLIARVQGLQQSLSSRPRIRRRRGSTMAAVSIQTVVPMCSVWRRGLKAARNNSVV